MSRDIGLEVWSPAIYDSMIPLSFCNIYTVLKKTYRPYYTTRLILFIFWLISNSVYCKIGLLLL